MTLAVVTRPLGANVTSALPDPQGPSGRLHTVACEAATLKAATAASLLNPPAAAGKDASAGFDSLVEAFDSAAAFATALPTPTLPTFTGAAEADTTALGAAALGSAVADEVAEAPALAFGGADNADTEAGSLTDISEDAAPDALLELNLSAIMAPPAPTAKMPATMPTISPSLFLRGGI